MSEPEVLEEFTLPSFDEVVETSKEPGSLHRKPDVPPPGDSKGELPHHLEKGKEFEAIEYFEGYDASLQERPTGATSFGDLDTGEEAYNDEQKQALASEFSTDSFIRENSLLTDAESYAKSIREGAQLYKQQLLRQTEQAHAEAEEYKREALTYKQSMEEERQAVLRDAYTEAEEIKQKGYQDGFEAGRQEGMQQRFRESEYLANQMNSVIEQLANLRQVVRFQAEQELVQLSVLIAKRVVVQELETNPEILQNILAKALKEIETKGKIQVFLHPEDYEFMQNTGVNLDQYMADEQTLSLKVNQDAEPGSIFIETDDDVLNFTFQQQFEQIEEELSQRLAERQVQMHSVDMDGHDFSVTPELAERLPSPPAEPPPPVAESPLAEPPPEVDPADLFGDPAAAAPEAEENPLDPHDLFGNFDEH